MKAWLAILVLGVVACGGATARSDSAARSSDRELANADDPAPFSPGVSSTARTNERVGVSVGGSSEEAVRIVQRYFDAIRTRDAATMYQLLGEFVLRRGRPLAAEEEIMMRFATAERAGFGLSIATGDFFDFAHTTVTRVSDIYAGVLPSAYRADDVVVNLPMRPIATDMLADVSQRAQALRLVIRMRPEPRILGY